MSILSYYMNHIGSASYVPDCPIETDAQFISHEHQWAHQADAENEAHHLRDECVPPCNDERAAEQGRADVACSEDGGWMAALDERAPTEVRIDCDTSNGGTSEYRLCDSDGVDKWERGER
jgi:hypothetical protein